MKADLKRVINFLVIVTTTIAVLVIMIDCISMINAKFHTSSVFNLIADPLKIIALIDLLIFAPSTLVFGYIYLNKYNTENIEVNWTKEQELAYARS